MQGVGVPACQNDVMGTPYYLAPELVAGGGIVQGRKNDVWSAGVIFFQILTGNLPQTFETAPDEHYLYKAIASLDITKDPKFTAIKFAEPQKQEKVVHVLKGMLTLDYNDRMSAAQAKDELQGVFNPERALQVPTLPTCDGGPAAQVDQDAEEEQDNLANAETFTLKVKNRMEGVTGAAYIFHKDIVDPASGEFKGWGVAARKGFVKRVPLKLGDTLISVNGEEWTTLSQPNWPYANTKELKEGKKGNLVFVYQPK